MEEDRRPFVERMNLAVLNVGDVLKVPKSLLRANIFTQSEGGRLSIPPGFHYNMHDETELTVSIPVGAGCTGRAFSESRPAIAVFQEGWGQHALPDKEAEKVDKRLQWVVSTPIPDPYDVHKILGVFNVDCLEVRKGQGELEILLSDLAVWAQALGKLFSGIGGGNEP